MQKYAYDTKQNYKDIKFWSIEFIEILCEINITLQGNRKRKNIVELGTHYKTHTLSAQHILQKHIRLNISERKSR